MVIERCHTSITNGNDVTWYEYICQRCGIFGQSYQAMLEHERSCSKEPKDLLKVSGGRLE